MSLLPLTAFSIAPLPRLEFGAGALAKLPGILQRYNGEVLLLTGRKAFAEGAAFKPLITALNKADISFTHVVRKSGEPSPQSVDALVSKFRGRGFAAVVGIGGGSTLDEAKAVAGLLKLPNSVMDFLEGVGPELPYPGPATAFIAVPTTAGTGTEATKNAVLSKPGAKGFKKSFRDDALVPKWAIVDPDLIQGCPRHILAGDGMDAMTQLLEGYVSLRANPITDALALSGLASANEGLIELYRSSGTDASARAKMAYASHLSGQVLAQTGLGSVHGLAGPLGAQFGIPHGIVCGTLVAAATKVNIAGLFARPEQNDGTIEKYAKVSSLLHQRHFSSSAEATTALVERLLSWRAALDLPGLQSFGLTPSHFGTLVNQAQEQSSMKTNPLSLTNAEVERILHDCL